MLNPSQYKKILSLKKQGNSIRNIRRLIGHSRNTILKVLDIKSPPPFRTSIRPSKLIEYHNEIKEKFDIGNYTAKQIYDELIEDGYDGSYSTVKRYLSKLFEEKDNENKKCIRSKCKKSECHEKWIFSLLQGKISFVHLEKMFAGSIDSESAHELYILNGSLRYRNRSLTIFAHLKKIPIKVIAATLSSNRRSVRRYISKFETGGNKELFDFSRKEIKKFEEPKIPR